MNRVKFTLRLLLMCLAFINVVNFPAFCQEDINEKNWSENKVVKAKVLDVTSEKKESEDSTGKSQILFVKLMSDHYKGIQLKVPYMVIDQPGYDIELEPGDEVILSLEVVGNTIKNAYITEYGRDKKLLYLTVLFVLLLLVFGGVKGLKAVISLIITGGAIFLFLLPLIFKGYDPIITTVIVSAAVAMVTLTMIGGISAKTVSAIIGTTGGVIVAGILALIIGKSAYLTGFSDEEMQMLSYIPHQIKFDYRGILFAGMIIGALGAVMDVGMSIASAIEEIKKANPYLKVGDLIRAGMNVGRDIMGTMANTLILAYTGGAIPLMLVFMAYETPFLKVINLEQIATEIVRALAGSIGLILAIPITSITAGILCVILNRK